MRFDAILKHYDAKGRRRQRRELEWFRGQPSLGEAIELAALSIDHRGKMYGHQCCIRSEAIREAKDVLLKNALRLQACGDFEELLSTIEELIGDIMGVGELYTYDVALRIGSRVNLSPERVYLHAGAAVGARNLGFVGKERSLELESLPEPLSKLPASEVEDILCIYKDRFGEEEFNNRGLTSRCS